MPPPTAKNLERGVLDTLLKVERVKHQLDESWARAEDNKIAAYAPELWLVAMVTCSVLGVSVLIGTIFKSVPLLVAFAPLSIVLCLSNFAAFLCRQLPFPVCGSSCLAVTFSAALLATIAMALPVVNSWYTLHNDLTAGHPLPTTDFTDHMQRVHGDDLTSQPIFGPVLSLFEFGTGVMCTVLALSTIFIVYSSRVDGQSPPQIHV
tara:strand:+ start:453 stop:1070 length:618 start_codon:yes stop_codon:yes gene_type:complete